MTTTLRIVPQAPTHPMPELAAFLRPFCVQFARSEGPQALERYLTGLLTELPDKTCQAIADNMAQNWRSCHEPPSGNFPENGAWERSADEVEPSVSQGMTSGTFPKTAEFGKVRGRSEGAASSSQAPANT
jgi:hypothetical protein